MSDVNIVVLVGRLTRDAELKYTNSGMAICRFSIAINRRRKQGDQWVDEPNFFDVDYWGKGGEAVNQYLTKGKQVAVQGELRQDKWEQDGQSRSKIVINATNVQLLGSAGGSAGGASYDRSGGNGRSQAPAPQAQRSSGQSPEGLPPSGGDGFTDDIPF